MAGAGLGSAPDSLCQLPRNIQLPSGAGCSQTQGGRRVPFWPTPSEPQDQGIIPSFPTGSSLPRLQPREAIQPLHPPEVFTVPRGEGRLQALYRPQPGQQLPGGEGLPSLLVPPSQVSPTSARANPLGRHSPGLGCPWAFHPSRHVPQGTLQGGAGRISSIWPC